MSVTLPCFDKFMPYPFLNITITQMAGAGIQENVCCSNRDNHKSDSSAFSISKERSLKFRMKLEFALGNNT